MAFVKVSGSTVSFAEFSDVLERDQRLFDANEGINDEDVIEPLLARSTERILTKIRSSQWWSDYFNQQSDQPSSVENLPIPSADKVIKSKSDFTDLCVYTALAEYICPMIADFGSEDNAEYRKMGYYKQKADNLFGELITAGNWYDFDGSGAISTAEKLAGKHNLKRVR